MKLHLILLLASVFNISSGFRAEVRGPLGEETCTGDEYADFKECVMQGVAADPNIAGFVDLEDVAIVNRGGDRRLSCRGCPTEGAPRGTWCFTMCGSTRRRRLEEEEEGTDTPKLRRVQEEVATDTAVFEGGAYTGNVEAILILEAMTTCLDDGFMYHPCLGASDTMTMTVTL
jgi:hypothetical protein